MVNGKYQIIDTHCHVYPDHIAELAKNATDNYFDMHSVHTGELSDLFNVMDEDGVDHCVICYCATKPEFVKTTNDQIAKDVEIGHGRLTGLGSMQQFSEDQRETVRYIKSLGFHGVKLHPDMQNFVLDSPEGMEMLSAVNESGLPVLLHTGDKRYDFSNPDRVLHVAQEFPDMTIVGGHFAGWSLWLEAAEKLHELPNLYVDCSSSSFALSDSEFRECIELYGTDRVLFGTDYPMWDAANEIERLLSLGFSESDYTKIFSENAKKVFDLDI